MMVISPLLVKGWRYRQAATCPRGQPIKRRLGFRPNSQIPGWGPRTSRKHWLSGGPLGPSLATLNPTWETVVTNSGSQLTPHHSPELGWPETTQLQHSGDRRAIKLGSQKGLI